MRRLTFWFLLAALAGFSIPADLNGQNTIRGRILDPGGRPVPDLEVLLHRVVTGGGGSVALDTSDASGAFTLTAPADRDSSALYFVAIQSGGELSMGELQRLPFPSDKEYFIEAADPDVPQQAAPPVEPEARRAGLLVILTGLLILGAVAGFAWQRRPPADRRMLAELATTDDEKRRAALYARLKRDA